MSSGDTTTNTANTPPPATGGATPGTSNDTSKQRTTTNSQGAGGARNRSGANTNNPAFRISNFKGEVLDVGAVIGMKSENRTKDSMTQFQEKLASYVM